MSDQTGPAAPPSADELRARVHRGWTTVAPAWGEHAAYADSRAPEVTQYLLDAVEPRPGDRVLELASGPGGLGIAVAALVAPGEVVMSDVAGPMVEIAGHRAAAVGLNNVQAKVLDLEEIDEPDGSFDIVLCREGLMFAVDPARAVREIRRVLRPGGRTAVAVWGPREQNPWLGRVMEVVSAQQGRPVPPPGVPHPFALQDAQRLQALFENELFDVKITALSTPLHAASFDEWWDRTRALAGPLSAELAAMPSEAAQALRKRAREAVRPFETADGLDFPGVSLIATARR
jgi:enediyne biosynthesis protein CalE5